jgi:hypothetical protein
MLEGFKISIKEHVHNTIKDMQKFYAEFISNIKNFFSGGNISEDRPHLFNSIKHVDQRSNTKDFLLLSTSAGERRAGARKTV